MPIDFVVNNPDGTILPLDKKIYKERTGEKVPDGMNPYVLYTPFTETIQTGEIILKPGLGTSTANVFTGLAQAAVGVVSGNVIAPLVTLNQAATVSALKFL